MFLPKSNHVGNYIKHKWFNFTREKIVSVRMDLKITLVCAVYKITAISERKLKKWETIYHVN